MSTKQHFGIRILSGILVICCAAGCSKAGSGKLSIGVLTDYAVEDTAESANPLAIEQQSGFDLGLKSGVDNYHLVQASEGNQEDNVQTVIRSMVEEDKVVSIVGGTTNKATMRAASLANFFNVPMLIPGADGENVLPSNNLWVFRISSPSSGYASYIFGDVLKQSTATTSQNESAETSSSQILKLAIVYEQNTFGENAAVTTAETAMGQSMEIVYYGYYTPGEVDAEGMNTLAQDVKSSEPDLVYMVSNDLQEATLLNNSIHSAFGSGLAPIYLGQGSGFTSQTFLSAADNKNLYVIRQAIGLADCPAEIDTFNEAQSYASIYILDQAIKEAEANMPKQSWLTLKSDSEATKLATRREKIRDALKQLNITVPCIGQVAFDNTGENKNLQFELLSVNNGQSTVVAALDFRNKVQEVIDRDKLIIIE